MVSDLAALGSQVSEQANRLMNRLDANKDGVVTKQEYVDGRSNGVSEAQAAAQFEDMDQEGDGELGQKDLATAFEQLAAQLQSALLGAQAGAGLGGQSPNGGSSLLTLLDTDGDGTVSRSEFIANRPSFISEAKAAQLFDDIDSAGQGSVTVPELAAGLGEAIANGDANLSLAGMLNQQQNGGDPMGDLLSRMATGRSAEASEQASGLTSRLLTPTDLLA